MHHTCLLLIGLITAPLFAGCIDGPATDLAGHVPQSGAKQVPPPEPVEPEASNFVPRASMLQDFHTGPAGPLAPARSPVTFSGRVLAPDIFFLTYGYDCGDGGPYDRAAAGSLLQSFHFEESYDNWSFVFDSPGFEADFDQRYSVGYYASAYFGKVPPSSTDVTVCSGHHVGADFELTLIPPTSKVLRGRVLVPGSCDAASRFVLDGPFDGWTYSFNIDGVRARFYGKHWHADAAEGTVPDDAWAVEVCSESKADVEFGLILSPPAPNGNARGAQQHAGAWYAGLARPNAPCFSSGLPLPSDPAADGVLYDSFRINPATRGQPYKIAVTDNVAEEAPFLMPGVLVSFYDPGGEQVPVSSFAPKDSEGRIRPLVPDEAARGVLWSCETGPVRATYISGAFVE